MYNPATHRRRSIRLPGHDYRHPGAYFVTLVTRHRELLFGQVNNGGMILNPWGAIVDELWRTTAAMRPGVTLGEHVVMPNHLHGIIHLHDAPGGLNASSIAAIIKGFKATVSGEIKRRTGIIDLGSLWQRNYHDRIIRNEDEYRQITSYIRDNPARWPHDRLNAPHQ
ncbi:REP element-mobilizing transposase RayT [Fluviicoccus keumensis]|uniref:REP element-mobilizing transposase RayT n=1 Tax=Fluviicoccus keumensis TaxID=1435465 RepID=A0A4Q7ZBC4_9GAMM|nr:transposase [Fluviicoccus keumensis]RZU47912.1 REP element-mobilizing transposase RayT [Fluviicoccus keumensis]